MTRKRTNYDRGRETEYKIVKELEKAGYVNVGRSAGSHGIFDVVGYSENEVICIQAKRSKRPISFINEYKEDLKTIIEMLPEFSHDVVIQSWIWQDRKGWIEKLEIKSRGQKYIKAHSDEILKAMEEHGVEALEEYFKKIS